MLRYSWIIDSYSFSPAAIIRASNKIFYKLAIKPQATIKLNIPFHRQEHSLSCEFATLRMTLLYRGIDVPESELILGIGFDSTPKNDNVWGNPSMAFVGNIDGKMMVDGYGVHYQPIVNLANKYRPTKEFINWSLQDLAEEISSGNPVIVWGFVGNGKKISWISSDGTTIEAINGEHTRVAIGFAGPKELPKGFFLLDPIYGEIYFSSKKFLSNSQPFGNIGVIVY